MVIGAVQFERCSAEVLAVHENLLSTLRVFSGRVAPAHQFLRSRRQQFEACEVAIQNRQLRDVFFVERNGNVRAVGFQLRNFRSHFYGGGHRANHHGHVQLHRSVCGNLHACHVVALKTWRFDLHPVRVRYQVAYRIVSILVGGGLLDRTLTNVSNCHLGADHRPALRISYRPQDAAIHGLT